jgi:hypothetical protein
VGEPARRRPLSAGAAGLASSISGAAVTYAVGGDGDDNLGSGPTNKGSGGNGSNGPTSSNPAGTDTPGNPGQPGVVVIRYVAGSPLATGGTITSSGGYQIHTFTASGTFGT